MKSFLNFLYCSLEIFVIQTFLRYGSTLTPSLLLTLPKRKLSGKGLLSFREVWNKFYSYSEWVAFFSPYVPMIFEDFRPGLTDCDDSVYGLKNVEDEEVAGLDTNECFESSFWNTK